MDLQIDLEELRKHKVMIATPMYGGQCAGGYAKSLAMLSSEFTKYNLQFQFYFLFNESLITRARNYCCDEFLRSDCTHLMFIDSDIVFSPRDILALQYLMITNEDYDVIGGPYPKKSLPGNAIIDTEDGKKNLSWIVNNKYTGKVLSYSLDKSEFEYKNIVSHSKFLDKNKKWVKITCSKGRKKFKSTVDHECLVIDNILDPSPYYSNASDTLGKYFIKEPFEESGNKNRDNRLFNKEQLSFMIGSLFGDSYITRYGRYGCGHSTNQIEYLMLKHKLFNGDCLNPVTSGFYKNSDSYKAYTIGSPTNDQTKHLRSIFYPNGKKTIKNAIDLLDDKGLAFWYLDDGSLRNKNCAIFCTDSFSYEDHVLIQKHLKDKFDIESTITPNDINKNKHNRLYIPSDSAKKMFSMISKYVLPEMEYKLPEAYRGGVKHVFNTDLLPYSALKVTNIEYLESYQYQYDIGVEDNHNFVADRFVVHNCISWEKIKLAVDKGIADEDPNVLSRFVGDYVFNPKKNTTTININEPNEVGEIGTGFMMITKDILNRYAEAYPDLKYKPDHARTKEFDGHREIHAFFDTIIDPDSRRYLSEDYMFCYNVNKMGGKVLLCPWMQMSHVGTYEFGGSLRDLASIGANPTAEANKSKKSN